VLNATLHDDNGRIIFMTIPQHFLRLKNNPSGKERREVKGLAQQLADDVERCFPKDVAE
jgi:hypothetical protein